jgi:hypothetical protein
MNRNELFNNELDRLHNVINSNVNESFKRWARDRIEIVQSDMLHFVYEESIPELPETPECLDD